MPLVCKTVSKPRKPEPDTSAVVCGGLAQTRKNPEGALTEVITLSGFSTRLVLQP